MPTALTIILADATTDTPTWAVVMVIVSVLAALVSGAMSWLSRRGESAGDRADQAGDRALDARLDAINAKLDLVQTEVRGVMQRHDADLTRLYDRVQDNAERLVALETRMDAMDVSGGPGQHDGRGGGRG